MRDELDRARRTLISTSATMPRSVLAAVALGGAFGLGILAGGVGEARGNAPADDDVLVTARARAELLAQKQGEIKLAYPAELLAPEAGMGARPAAIVVEGAAPAKAPADAQPAEPAADKRQPDRREPEQAKAPQQKAPNQVPSEKPTADTAVAERQPDPEPEPAPREASERPSIQATLAKVLGGAPPTTSSTPPAKPKTFALQVASLPDRSAAEALAKKLAGQGLSARVAVGEVGGREVFRVRVGAFAERDKAEAAKSKLAMPSFIISE